MKETKLLCMMITVNYLKMIYLDEAAVGLNIFQSRNIVVVQQQGAVVQVAWRWVNFLQVLTSQIQHLRAIYWGGTPRTVRD
jgi:hypothetical protein